jgi:hypothetical protein
MTRNDPEHVGVSLSKYYIHICSPITNITLPPFDPSTFHRTIRTMRPEKNEELDY